MRSRPGRRRRSSERVFIWTEYKRWNPVVRRLIKDLVDDSVFKEIKRHPPEYFVGDNLSWLEHAILRVKGLHVDLRPLMAERLLAHYRYLRAYHGCRPISLDSYTAHGILPSDPVHLDKLAVEIFGNDERVQAAIIELRTVDFSSSYAEHNGGKVFFCLDKEYMIEYCGHYLLSGSEYLQGIACRVGKVHELRRRGRATVIECNVPMKDVPANIVEELAGEALREIFERQCDPAYEPGLLNFGFPIHVKLAAENIAGFDHPTSIRNPHNFTFGRVDPSTQLNSSRLTVPLQPILGIG